MWGRARQERGRSPEALSRSAVGVALAAGALGGLGLLGGPRGALDAVVLLAWLALMALPLGVLVGAAAPARRALWFLPPALWSFLLFEAELLGPASQLARPSLGLVVAAGLHFCGVGLGVGLPDAASAIPRAGGALLLALALAVAPVALGDGFGRDREPVPPRSIALARLLLDADPLTWVLEPAGLDWTHRQGLVYRRAGVEWIERRPWRGVLAPALLLVVGWSLASVRRRSRAVP